MKVIDLLNKIANEEVRHDIKINTRNYYCSIEEYLKKFGINEDTLNVEVIGFDDIIEEDKKIRKIKVNYSPDIDEEIFYEDGDKPSHCVLGDAGTKLLINKINEIIDKINGGTNE